MSDTDITTVPTVPGTPFAGGFYAGSIFINNELFALIAAPKAEGEHDNIAWNDSYQAVDGAKSFCDGAKSFCDGAKSFCDGAKSFCDGAKSFCDGLANTKAMAEAGSKLAAWALKLNISGFNDWYLPSFDELEILYRHLKPTTKGNSPYGRSGINVSAAPPTYPYTNELPAQTSAETFKDDGAEAFEETWYWSSTQHASNSDYAWDQDFDVGYQSYDHKSCEGCARAVRRLKI